MLMIEGAIVSTYVVFTGTEPMVAVMVTLYVPGSAHEVPVKVSTDEPEPTIGLTVKLAVTPGGIPVVLRVVMLLPEQTPLKMTSMLVDAVVVLGAMLISLIVPEVVPTV